MEPLPMSFWFDNPPSNSFSRRFECLLSRQVVSRLRRSELGILGLGELSLQAKALKLAGGILWKLGRKERSVRRYLECLQAAAAVQDHQDATHER